MLAFAGKHPIVTILGLIIVTGAVVGVVSALRGAPTVIAAASGGSQ